jgi:hypothetical protein
MESKSLAGRVVRLGVLLAIAVAVGGGAGVGQAASPIVTIDLESTPLASGSAQCPASLGTCTLIPYTTLKLDGSVDQAAYVEYRITSIANNSGNTLNHVSVADPASCSTAPGAVTPTCIPGTLPGASLAYAQNCPGAQLGTAGAVCDIGTLRAGGTWPTITLVFRTRTVPTGCSFLCVALMPNKAAIWVSEGTNDQTDSAHVDTFPTREIDLSLTADTVSSFQSVTVPSQSTTTLSTTQTLSSSNKSATKTTVPSRDFTSVGGSNFTTTGALVTLGERPIAAGECPASYAAAKISCFGEVSTVGVDGSGLYTCTTGTVFDATLCPGALAMTFTDFAGKGNTPGSVPSGFKLANLRVFHVVGAQTEDVPLCSTGKSATFSGDCVFSATQDSDKNVTITVQGPAQGTWGKGG